jgi:hypothetical protein
MSTAPEATPATAESAPVTRLDALIIGAGVAGWGRRTGRLPNRKRNRRAKRSRLFAPTCRTLGRVSAPPERAAA